MNLEPYLNLIIGTIFLFIIGFFVMEFVLAAISLATGFDNSKKTAEAANKQMTGAVKGLALALATYFLLNTILYVFGITNPGTEGITKIVSDQFKSLMNCLRDFSTCGTGSTPTTSGSGRG